jgi:hypothetical protein
MRPAFEPIRPERRLSATGAEAEAEEPEGMVGPGAAELGLLVRRRSRAGAWAKGLTSPLKTPILSRRRTVRYRLEVIR